MINKELIKEITTISDELRELVNQLKDLQNDLRNYIDKSKTFN